MKLIASSVVLSILWLAALSCSNEGVRGGAPSTAGRGGTADTPDGSPPGGTGGGGGEPMPGSGGSGGGGGAPTAGSGGTGGGAGGMGMAGRSVDAGRRDVGAPPRDSAPPSPPPDAAPAAPSVAEFACIKNRFNQCFQDSWILFGCFSQAGQDCVTNRAGTACPNQDPNLPMEQQGLTSDEFFTMGGTSGRSYRVSITVTGIAEGKYYERGRRSAGDTTPANINGADGIDGFYVGGNPVDQENYNIYKLTVRNPSANPATPQAGTEVAHYYLNSMPSQFTQGEAHNTFAFRYSKDIVVPGGGVIQYHTADRNCRAVDNCGPGSRNAGCAVGDGRRLPGEPNVMIPATYQGQPVTGLNTRNGANQPFHAQIFHITVTAVTPM
jgi:hypothetical protein